MHDSKKLLYVLINRIAKKTFITNGYFCSHNLKTSYSQLQKMKFKSIRDLLPKPPKAKKVVQKPVKNALKNSKYSGWLHTMKLAKHVMPGDPHLKDVKVAAYTDAEFEEYVEFHRFLAFGKKSEEVSAVLLFFISLITIYVVVLGRRFRCFGGRR